jgi:hypothetical protein
VDASDERLVVRSVTSDTAFYFDVPSRQFVPSMTAIVPTATTSISPLLRLRPNRATQRHGCLNNEISEPSIDSLISVF